MTTALQTTGLAKQFGGLKVTRDLSLRIERGARHALIGPNGAGKTTVINLLTGVLKPNGGRILLEGNDITDLPVHTRVLRGLSRTFQINQVYADLTPLEAARRDERTDGDVTLWQTAAAGDRGRHCRQAARAAARRARRRRSRKRTPRYSCRRGSVAARRHRAADRARHGSGVLVRRSDFGAGGRPTGRGGARRQSQGCLSRRGRRCLICCVSKVCARATAKRWYCPICRCICRKARCWRCWVATAPARPR